MLKVKKKKKKKKKKKYSATTNSSATLERMGSRCLFYGTVSADFQEGGKRLSSKDLLMISDIVSERRSAFSFSNHAGIPSGPDAFQGLIDKAEGKQHA